MARKNQSTPKSFEEALRELEQLVTDVESGEVGLEESLARYERGQFLVQHCRRILSTAEKQIEQLNAAETPVVPESAAEPESDDFTMMEHEKRG